MNLPHHRRASTTPRKLINRIERAITRGYQFAANVRYHWLERGNTLRDSIELARVTLP